MTTRNDSYSMMDDSQVPFKHYKGYEYDEEGRITSLGKMEAETVATVYFWYMVMEGDSGRGEVYDNGKPYTYFDIALTDVGQIEHETGIRLGWLEEAANQGKLFRVFENDNGFVYGRVVTVEEYESHIEDAEDGLDTF